MQRDSLDALEKRKIYLCQALIRDSSNYLACILFTIWTELPQLIYVYVALYATILIDLCFIFVLRLQCWPWKVNIDVTANFLSSQKLSE